MFRRFSIVFLGVMFLVVGCTAPTDVDATRKKTIIDAPPDILRFAELPSVITFGSLRQFSSKSVSFTCGNSNADQAVTITSVKLKHGDRGFTLGNVNLPIIVQPNTNPYDLFPIQFSANKPGFFSDTIILNKSENYYVPLYATVRRLSVRTSDIEFQQVKIGVEKIINVVIENLDTVPITVEGFTNDDVEFAFYLKPIEKVTIDPGKSVSYPIVFTPSKAKTYNTIIRFSVKNATDEVDNEAILSGTGVVQ